MQIENLREYPVQTYLTDKVQLYDILEQVLRQTGRSSLWITTFSVSEEFIRRIHKLKEAELADEVHLILDTHALGKITRLVPFMQNVFSSVSLASNHSKVILVASRYMRVTVLTSQNQTRGNRYESGAVLTDPAVFDRLYSQMALMSERSINIQDVLNRTTR